MSGDLFSLDGPGVVPLHATQTSARAAVSPVNQIRFGSQRYQVLVHLMEHGPSTAAEIAAPMGISRNQCATRILECEQAGWVRRLAETRPTSADAEGHLHEITMRGVYVRCTVQDHHERQGS